MANEQHIKNFTAADIAAYHKGQLSSKEMHDLEQAALEDPFLADALEGYQVTNTSTSADLKELSSRLRDRIHEEDRAVSPGFSIPWLKVAAMIVIIAGAALLIYYLGGNNGNEHQLAKEEGNKNTITVTDTGNTNNIPTLQNQNSDTGIVSSEINRGLTQSPELATKPIIPAPDKATTNLFAADSTALNVPANRQVDWMNSQTSKEKDELLEKEALAYKSKELELSNARRKAETNTKVATAANQESKSAPTATANNGFANMQRSDSFKDQENRSNNYNVFRGRVTDNANNPLPFVNITNPIDNVGTYSDAKGYFSMIYPDTVLNVNIRSLGFSSKNTQLLNRVADNQIVMQEDRSNLNEVVVSNKKINSKTRENNLVLEEPEPADGWNNYDTYLANNLVVPDTYLTKSSGRGEVVLSFEVNKQGQPVDIKVEKSLCETCDKEAIRALKEGPKWKKKAKKGRASVSISF